MKKPKIARSAKVGRASTKLWRTVPTLEGEAGSQYQGVFSDIYEGDECIVGHIYFDKAEKLVERHNR